MKKAYKSFSGWLGTLKQYKCYTWDAKANCYRESRQMDYWQACSFIREVNGR